LTTSVHEAEKLSLEQIEALLNASQGIRFEGETQGQIYHWIEQVLSRQQYSKQSRAARGLLRRYLAKMTGVSRAQVTRLIGRYLESGALQRVAYRRHRFPRPCAQAEIEVDRKGRQRCFYRRYQTPLETLLALRQPEKYLREGLTVAVLQCIAATRSDTEAAQRMQQVKRKLFEQLRLPANGPWK
jgi:hypothetical protein